MVERCEQEYKRHGTTSLIASRDVVTGKIVNPSLGKTRTEKDFAKHIKEIIELNDTSNIIFIMDQLNTHKSETLVKLFAKHLSIPEETLGIKGIEGILKSKETRAAFLSNKSNRIRIVYTPKHSSWLNQIEMWFSILTRRFLNKRSSFSSVKDLEHKILKFVEYYNEFLAKAFKWTYAGKVLQK